MKTIAVFYGGKSVEHDISIITALQVMRAMPKGYKMIPIYIMPKGEFVTAANLNDAGIYLDFDKKVQKLRKIVLNLGKNEIFVLKNDKIKEKIKIDCALLCNHGHGGEDGSLQGLLELCEIPYSSSPVDASVITMDKVLTKIFLTNEHILTPSFFHFDKSEYEFDKNQILRKICDKISFPCIVKPARLGSSVGINVCLNEDVLNDSVEFAFQFDNKIIVEKFVENAREFCCAAIRSGKKIYLSNVTQVYKNDVYTFEEKYLSSDRKQKDKIDRDLVFRIKRLTEKVYEKLGCEGVVRIDFLYCEKENKIYVNEPNSIPGSLAFNMFDGNFGDFIDLIIKSSTERFDKKREINYTFNSEAIKHFIEMAENQKTSK